MLLSSASALSVHSINNYHLSTLLSVLSAVN